jgi:hypothetical protein
MLALAPVAGAEKSSGFEELCDEVGMARGVRD